MKEQEFDYINVIPFVDIMLVLLTIVLTTSTFIATGVIPVELPKVAKKHEDTLKTRTVEIDRSGQIFASGRQVTIDELSAVLKGESREVPVLIRADRDVTLQSFVDVIDLVKRMEFRKVSLQTVERR
ncbi:MAG TPA: biopolymer transporter ExbD [Dissulfurispiraceae bacterium]|nr:biopolymer transporter ExbD [Dissulfurispiraceae bacterium]